MHNDARGRTLLRAAAILAAGSSAMLACVRLLMHGPDPVMMVLAASALGFAIVPALRDRVAAPGLILVGMLALGSTAWLEDGLLSDSMYWLPFLPLVGGFFLGRQGALATTVIALALVAGVGGAELGGVLPTDAPVQRLVTRIGSLCAAITFGGGLGMAYEELRVQSESRLRQSRRKTTQLLASLPNIVVRTENGRPVPINREILEPRIRAAMIESPGAETLAADGRHYAVHPLQLEDDEQAFMLTDITEQHRIDAMKDAFIGTVSHELRTPLTGLAGSIRLLRAPLDDQRRVQLIDVAERNVARLERQVERLLHFQRLQDDDVTVDVERTELSPILDEVVEALRGTADSMGVTITSNVSPAAAQVDPRHLSSVVRNLLTNAVQHSPAGTEVTVELTEAEGTVRIAVRDRGPGIPASADVFAPFTLVDSSDSRSTGGSGLGLALARGLVDRMGGRIWFESTEDDPGTTFFVELDA